MKNGNRLLSAGLGLIMVLGLFVAAIGSVPVAAAVATPTPVVTITHPATSGTVTDHTYMNVTWSVSPTLSKVWNWTRIYEAHNASAPSWDDAKNNVSGQNYNNFTLWGNNLYKVDVMTVHINATGKYQNSSVASVTFTGIAPGVVVTNPPAYTNNNNITARWTNFTTGTPIENISVTLTNVTHLHAYPTVVLSSSANNVSLKNIVHANLADGSWKIMFMVNDTGGNVSYMNYTFVVDTVKPKLSVTAPPSYTNNNNLTATWTMNGTGSPIKNVNLNITNDTTHKSFKFDLGAVSNTTLWNLLHFKLVDGAWTMKFNVTDEAGNFNNSVTYNFVVDTVNPTLSVTAPPAFTNDNNATVRWTMNGTGSPVADVKLTVVNVTTGDSFGPFSLGAVNNTTLFSHLQFLLQDGTWNLTFNVTDAAGNFKVVDYSFVVDTIEPTLTVTSPPLFTNNDNLTATWTMSGTGSPIANVVLTVTNDTTGESFGPFSLGAVDNVTLFDKLGFNLVDGNWDLQFNVTDEAGNYRVVEYEFVVDTVAPTIDVLNPTAGEHWNAATLVGEWNITDATSGVKDIMVKLDSGSFVDIGLNSTYAFTGLTNGQHTIYVKAIDNASNEADANVTFTVDLIAPTITGFQPSGSAVPLTSNIVITFSEPMLKSSVTITVTPTPPGLGSAVWSNNNMTVTYFVQSAASTSYTVKVTGTDLAGNALTGTTTYTYGSLNNIVGIVVDVNNNPLAGANVTITSTLAGGPTYYTTTSDTGAINILVAAGTYNVKITLSGYDEIDKNGVTFGAGQATNNLGTLSMTKTMDWTVPIIIIVIGLIVIVAILFLFRRK